jgi:hypothetical protein
LATRQIDHNNYLLTAVFDALIAPPPHIPTLTRRITLGIGKARVNQAGNTTVIVMMIKTRVTRTGGGGDIITITVTIHRTHFALMMTETAIIGPVQNRHDRPMENRDLEFPRL